MSNLPKNTLVKRFDSPEDYGAYLRTIDNNWRYDRDGHWGSDWDACCRNLDQGDTRNLAAAEKLIDQMQDEHIFSVGLPVMVPSVVGGRVNVPASIMGHPLDMYSTEMSESQDYTTPLTIYIETVVSGGLSVKELNARGIAALAFALAMSNIRPVEIYAVSGGRPYGGDTAIMVTRIASNPLDLARAVFMLTDESYARKMGFAAMCDTVGRDTSGIAWAWNGFPTNQDYTDKMRLCVGAEPQDVLISGGHLNDTLMLKNPVQWVKNMIAKHSNTQEG